MSVRYATPGGGRINNILVMQGLSIDNAEVNFCSSYVSRRKKEKQRRSSALKKCMSILDTIHKKKLSRLSKTALRKWIEEKKKHGKMLELAHVSQLEYILERYTNAKLQEIRFLKELEDL